MLSDFRCLSTTITLALLLLALQSCTCAGDSSALREQSANEDVTIEVATAPGMRPVTLVLDPSGDLCKSAARAAAGGRHVLCDRTEEDLSAAALKRALTRLKAQRGGAVGSEDAWLVSAPARAAVARSLAMGEPSFFSRVAAWVGTSPVTAGLFGPTFLASVGGRGFRSLVLLGPGAEQGRSWVGLASRQSVHLVVVPDAAVGGEARTWAALTDAFAEP